MWDLGASGWANSFYSAAVQAGTKSWKAMFCGSSDSSNFITVDKSPAFLWPMEILGPTFGLNSWSRCWLPQALEGVATVGVVYLSVRRWFSAQAAPSPPALSWRSPSGGALMFRYNNPDALLALLLTAATYATTMRGIEKAQTKWLVLAGALVGFGFITKMMQAFLILPVMAVVYLVAAPTGWWRRVWQTFLMGVSVVVAAGWWVAIVAPTPRLTAPECRRVAERQHPQLLDFLAYNGFGRLDGSESGSVGGGRVAGSMWGPTGLTRLFNAEFGNMMSWLLPGALVMGAVLLVVTLRSPSAPIRAAPAPTLGRLTGEHRPRHQPGPGDHPPLLHRGARATARRTRRHRHHGPVGAPDHLGRARRTGRGVGRTVVWSYVLLGRTSEWFPALRPFVAVVGALGVVAILALPLLRTLPKLAIALVATLGLGAALAAPLFSTVATAATPHNGAIPSVTPTASGGFGGPGGGFPGGTGGFPGAGARRAFGGGGGFPGGTQGGGFPGSREVPNRRRCGRGYRRRRLRRSEHPPSRHRWRVPTGRRVRRRWSPAVPVVVAQVLEFQPVQRRAQQGTAS